MPELCQAKSRSDPASLPQNKRRGCPKSRKVSVARHRLALRYPIEYVPFRDLSDDLSDIPLRVYGDFPHPEDHFTPSGKSSTQAENHLPQAENHLPQAENHLPQAENHLPQAENHLPQAENHLPKAENRLPQAENYLPP